MIQCKATWLDTLDSDQMHELSIKSLDAMKESFSKNKEKLGLKIKTVNLGFSQIDLTDRHTAKTFIKQGDKFKGIVIHD